MGIINGNPDELVEISNEWAKLCKIWFNEVAIAHTPAKKASKNRKWTEYFINFIKILNFFKQFTHIFV